MSGMPKALLWNESVINFFPNNLALNSSSSTHDRFSGEKKEKLLSPIP